jgi:hypothetical protein
MILPDLNCSSKSVFWRVVYQNSRGNHYLDLLELKIGDSGSAMMKKLRDRYRHANARAPLHSLEKYLHLWTPVIETATLSPVRLHSVPKAHPFHALIWRKEQ